LPETHAAPGSLAGDTGPKQSDQDSDSIPAAKFFSASIGGASQRVAHLGTVIIGLVRQAVR
jgi:hypothetical protein